jgi:tetratricopeptide (TPR) repeat protein/predicted Ser/Thr protein kinase
MGVVCTAYDPKLERKVAIKLLRNEGPRPAGSTMTAGQARLFREAQALAKLSHPNVVTVHDVDTHEGEVYVAMEYVEGQSLKDWLRARRRPWRGVVEMFLAAGRGLAAAHAAGIIHRDFKPANVLIGNDGRVRVADFGLAKASGDAREPDAAQTGELRVVEGAEDGLMRALRSASDLTLTMAGHGVGTPAYMAPEQHMGLPVGPQTDQFSFCVSLWEGLYGELPFSGDTLEEQFRSVMGGHLRPVPRETDVPPHLHRLMLRGLSVQAAQRFPSMEELLSELMFDPAARRRRFLWGGAAAVAVLVAGGGALQLANQRASLCAGGEEHVARVWSSERADAIHRAFAATKVPFAGAAAQRVVARLDAWSTGWAAGHRAVCEATHVRGEQSAALLDLRMSCLEDELDAAGTLVEGFTAADAVVVEKAVAAVYELGGSEPCGERQPAAADAPPSDPVAREAMETAARYYAEARALASIGRSEEAQARVSTGLSSANAANHVATRVRGELLRADLLIEAGRREGVEALRAATLAAADAGLAEAEALGWLGLLYAVGTSEGQLAEARALELPVEAAIRRAGAGERLQQLHASHRGAVEFQAGDFARARDAFAHAVELATGIYGATAPRTLADLGNLAAARARTGELSAAEADYTRALLGAAETLGEAHPQVVDLHLGRGNVYVLLGKFREARDEFLVGLRAHGEADTRVRAALLASVAATFLREGQTDETATWLRRAADTRGADPAEVVRYLLRLAEVHQMRERGAEALVVLDDAVVHATRELPPGHARRLAAFAARCGAHQYSENGSARAERDCVEFLEEVRTAPELPPERRARAFQLVAAVDAALGRREAAHLHVREALGVLERSGAAPAALALAELRVAAAHVGWRPAARASQRRRIAAWVQRLPEEGPERAALAAWLGGEALPPVTW